MRKIFFICTFLVVSLFAFSQAEKINSDSCYAVKEKDTTWQTKCVQQQPEFLGGDQGLFQFLVKNIKYPQLPKEMGVQGKVFVEFIVDKSGSVQEIKLVKPILIDEKNIKPKYLEKSKEAATQLNEEALRVISIMPKWKPGLLYGKPVNVRFVLPIGFKLQ